VTPPGVTEPYRRGTETARAARSQRERDDDAKRVVLAAGEFLRRVGALLADPRIHPASADLLRWYEEEITDARRDRDGRRLAELAGEFADDATARAFRRLRWWQGEPAALAPGTDEDDYDEGQGAVLEFAGEAAAAVAAVPAAGPAQGEPMTWAAAVAACGWQLAVAGSAGVQWCQVVDEHGQQCRTGATSPGIADGRGGHAWLCGRHYGALGRLITDANRLRGIT
jgi:hypothetical protein